MLIYQPAFDINHTRLRMLELLHFQSSQSWPVDQLRIADFYFLFPHLLAVVPLQAGTIKYKNRLKLLASRYNRVPNPQELFRRMKGTQQIALNALASAGFLNSSALEGRIATRTTKPLPPEIMKLIADMAEDERELVTFIAERLGSLQLNGPNGLKARTGLMEFRYDPT